MNGLPVHCTLSILRRFHKNVYTKIAKILTLYNIGLGWKKAINNSQLFILIYQYSDNDVASNKSVELQVWKRSFPEYPLLTSNWETNYGIYNNINREMFIQKALYRLLRSEVTSNTHNDMLEFKNPKLSMHELITFLQISTYLHIKLPEFIDNLIEIRKWPDGVISANDFWKCVFQVLPIYKKKIDNNDNDLYTFIKKYIEYVDWKEEDIYRIIKYDFIQSYKHLWGIMDWKKIIKLIQLPTYVLEEIMTFVNTKKPYYGKYLNPAHIVQYQVLNEQFIEKWFVNQLYDQEHIWAIMFESQHLSEEFKTKYKYKKPKSMTSKILDAVKELQTNVKNN